MTSDELRAEVLRLYHAEAWPIGTIARTLGVHHDVVARVLKREGLPPIRAVRPTILEPYLPFIRETLEEYPRLQARRLYDMCVDRGYSGSPDHFRHLVRSLRPKPRHEPFGRLATLISCLLSGGHRQHGARRLKRRSPWSHRTCAFKGNSNSRSAQSFSVIQRRVAKHSIKVRTRIIASSPIRPDRQTVRWTRSGEPGWTRSADALDQVCRTSLGQLPDRRWTRSADLQVDLITRSVTASEL